MMKCCCLIVFIFCTIDVSNGGILSGKCLASNGTCGTKGVPCNETFGSGWTYYGKCCNNRPCCKYFDTGCLICSSGTCGTKGVPCNETFGSGWMYNGTCCNNRPCCKFFSLKRPCVLETSCPEGYRLLPNQASSDHCYKVFQQGTDTQYWNKAYGACVFPRNGYLWRPNTAQEANAVKNLFNFPNDVYIWTGANDWTRNGIYRFSIEYSIFSFDSLPFGLADFSPFDPNKLFGVMIKFDTGVNRWIWKNQHYSNNHLYVCEYPRPCR